jgi:protein-S-isoprenylcysteine O-methyltransferase Ste14
MVLFILSFLVCFIGYFLHTLWHYQAYQGIDHRQRGRIFNIYTHSVVFIGYLAFGLMMFTDPLKMNICNVLRITGMVVGASGIFIGIVATFQKKGYSEADQLVKTGIYSKLRNPMYLGIIAIHIGLPLFFECMITLLSAVIWIPMIFLWKFWEEKHLVNKFGEEYIRYKKKTWF